jgi:hypothetical protein
MKTNNIKQTFQNVSIEAGAWLISGAFIVITVWFVETII